MLVTSFVLVIPTRVERYAGTSPHNVSWTKESTIIRNDRRIRASPVVQHALSLDAGTQFACCTFLTISPPDNDTPRV